jgi:hypothetical protein
MNLTIVLPLNYPDIAKHDLAMHLREVYNDLNLELDVDRQDVDSVTVDDDSMGIRLSVIDIIENQTEVWLKREMTDDKANKIKGMFVTAQKLIKQAREMEAEARKMCTCPPRRFIYIEGHNICLVCHKSQ